MQAETDAHKFDASLATVSILGDLPAYTSFAILIDPGVPAAMREDRRRLQSLLHEEATRLAHERGVSATSAIVEGRETQAILHFLREQKADLLVIGLHQHDFYVSRLWSSMYDVAQDAPLQRAGRALTPFKQKKVRVPGGLRHE
jgi:nucleotide-binding universal stress UspA family protein